MSIRTLLHFRNPDLTKDLNDRYVGLINPGVFDGGSVIPVTGQLRVDLLPWKIADKNGMVSVETSDTVRKDTPAGQITVIAVHSVYVQNNDAIIETVAIEQGAFLLLTNISDYIVMAEVDVPIGATQILSSYVKYQNRMETTKVGRALIRGYVTSTAALPTAEKNNVADAYFVGDGIGGPLNIYGWNGTTWQVLTDFVQLSSDLANHRANAFTNEKHLTDDEWLAALGSFGAPSSSNPYVTSTDPRVPTQSENDALQGSTGAPSNTNRYVTQLYPLALPFEKTINSPPITQLELQPSDQPVFVGKAGILSANVYFKLYHFTEPREYTNTSGLKVSVSGVFKDIALTIPLDPSSDSQVDVNGFYLNNVGSIFLAFDHTVDSNARIVYGKGTTLKTIPVDFLLRRGVNDGQTNADTVIAIEAIKGRFFDDVPPVPEQNIELRKSVISTQEYLSTSFVADHVVEDFGSVKNVPEFSADFVENVGIPPIYGYQNSGLIAFTYAPSTGTVTYSSAVSLGSVTAGMVFMDGALKEFKVQSTGVNSVVIKTRNGTIPLAISNTVTVSDNGSIKTDNNPRSLNLSDLRLISGRDRVPIRGIASVSNEFHPATGDVANRISTPVDSERFGDKRVRLYGGFQNQALDRSAYVVCNGPGRILITGFYTDLHLVCDAFPASPTLSVYLDGSTTATTVDLSIGGTIADFRTDPYLRQRIFRIAENLADGVPHTVEVVVSDTTDPFIVHGFELIRRTLTSVEVLPGRAFVQTELAKFDSLQTYSSFSTIPGGRGGVSIRYVDRTKNQSLSNYQLTDLDGTLNQPAGTAVSGTPNFTVTSGLTKFQFYRPGDVVKIATALDEEVKIISTIGPSIGQVVFTNNVTINGSAALIHMASTVQSGDTLDPSSEFVRFAMSEFGQQLPQDFSLFFTAPSNVTYTLEDGLTSVAGFQVQYTASGIEGTDRAVQFVNSSSTFAIRTVCNGMAFLISNTAAANADISIDGSPFQTVNLGGGGLQNYKVFSDARYQTHEVRIQNATGLMLSDVIFFEPVQSPQPEGTILGTQNLLSRYAISNNTVGEQTPLGVAAVSPYSYGGRFVNGAGTGNNWTSTIDFVNNPTYGRYTNSDREGSYFEFDIFGEGFEYEYISGPDRGIPQIFINGVLATNVNFAAVFRGMDEVLGEVDMYSASYSRQRFSVNSLPYNLYTVRIQMPNPRKKNVSSAGFNFNISVVYISNISGVISVTPAFDKVTKLFFGLESIRDSRPVETGLEIFIPATVLKPISVRDSYVTVGPNVTDDYVVTGSNDQNQIQAAINFVSGTSTYRKVIVKPKIGSYDIQLPMTVPAGIIVESVGAIPNNNGAGTCFQIVGSGAKVIGFDFRSGGFTTPIDVNGQLDFQGILNLGDGATEREVRSATELISVLSSFAANGGKIRIKSSFLLSSLVVVPTDVQIVGDTEGSIANITISGAGGFNMSGRSVMDNISLEGLGSKTSGSLVQTSGDRVIIRNSRFQLDNTSGLVNCVTFNSNLNRAINCDFVNVNGGPFDANRVGINFQSGTQNVDIDTRFL